MASTLGPLKPVNVEQRAMRAVPRIDLNLNDVQDNFTTIRTAFNDLCARVDALESIASGNPGVSNFTFTVPARVDAGTDLTGQSFSASYTLVAASLVDTARIVGIPTTPAGPVEVIVANASKLDGSNTQNFVFPAGVDFSVEGNVYTIRLELYTAGQTPGTDVPAVSSEGTILTQAAPRTDLLYFGVITDPTPANVDVTLLESQTRLDGDVTFPTGTENVYMVFAYPDSAAPITRLSTGGFEQLAAFTLTGSAITVEGTAYSVLISNNLLLPLAYSGVTWTITR